MTGKEYLSQYRRLKSRIKGKKAQVAELRESLLELRAIRYDLDKVDSSPSGDNILNGLIKLEDKCDSIARDITAMTELSDEITNRIGRMKSPVLMDLLTRYYILGESFEQIAVGLNYSYKTVLNYHGEALIEFEEVNEDIKLMEKYGNFGNKNVVI